MVLWSVQEVRFRCVTTHLPIQRWANWPGHKRHQNNIADVQESGKIHAPFPSAGPHQPHQQGVRNTPSRLETEAEQMAAATLPPAMEVNAMLDCTVEGQHAHIRIPMHKSGPSTLFHKGMLNIPTGENNKGARATSP